MAPKIRVLVVDDDDVDSMTAKRALTNSPLPVKFEVETTGTMATGLDKLSHGRFDVAVFEFGSAG